MVVANNPDVLLDWPLYIYFSHSPDNSVPGFLINPKKDMVLILREKEKFDNLYADYKYLYVRIFHDDGYADVVIAFSSIKFIDFRRCLKIDLREKYEMEQKADESISHAEYTKQMRAIIHKVYQSDINLVHRIGPEASRKIEKKPKVSVKIIEDLVDVQNT